MVCQHMEVQTLKANIWSSVSTGSGAFEIPVQISWNILVSVNVCLLTDFWKCVFDCSSLTVTVAARFSHHFRLILKLACWHPAQRADAEHTRQQWFCGRSLLFWLAFLTFLFPQLTKPGITTYEEENETRRLWSPASETLWERERTNGALQLFISRDCLFIKLMPGASTMIRLKQWWSSPSTADAASKTQPRYEYVCVCTWTYLLYLCEDHLRMDHWSEDILAGPNFFLLEASDLLFGLGLELS